MSVTPTDRDFEALLNYLKQSRGFDFSGYKRSSLMRRIARRMQYVDLENFADYIDYLEVHPDEFVHLFDLILINVTSFFRDSPTWTYVSEEIIPRITADKAPNDPIRIWSAGCASGEEAYTAAMVLAEALGIDQYRERVKIYASDADEQALSRARQAVYSAREVTGIPPHLLDKYFEHIDHRYIFRKDLRRMVIFGRHDLIQDAPISRIDLLMCRNTLMYFNTETQAKVLARFHFALGEKGYLFMGKAEMLFAHSNLFMPVDMKRRVFNKVAKVNLKERLLIRSQTDGKDGADTVTKHVRLRESAFDINPVAQIVLDLNGALIMANERARALLPINGNSLGHPIQDLEFSHRIVELRSRITEVYLERNPIRLKEVDWKSATGEERILEVQVIPLLEVNGSLTAVTVTFMDITHMHRLQQEIEHAGQELETAYEELQTANEELETTNEELESTVEELETTNEELQSTNEELETINEEMQSTNEELQTVNDEMRRRSDELNQVNAYLNSILTSMRGGVVVLNTELQVQIWNGRAEELWGLRASEVKDKNFLILDIGLPVEQLKQPMRACLSKEAENASLTLDAVNRRGKAIRCLVTCAPLTDVNGIVQGVILSMEEKEA